MKSAIKRIISVSLALLSCLFFGISTSANNTVTNDSTNNPYVLEFIKEHNSKINNNSASENTESTKSAEQADVETKLTNYYNDDVAVGNLLNKLYNSSSLLSKALAFNKNDRIDIMTKIESIYPSLTDITEQEILLSYIQRYADILQDKKSVNYYKDVNALNVLSKYYNKSTIMKTLNSSNDGDKIDIMHKIQDIYSIVSNTYDKHALYLYLQQYANISNDSQSIAFFKTCNAKSQSNNEIMKNIKFNSDKTQPQTVTALTQTNQFYDGNAAANWALENYNDYDSDYPAFDKWDNDCTNYVSQCMHVAGGLPYVDNWYCYKKNDAYLHPLNADQLNYSFTLANPSPFISCKQFFDYWESKVQSLYISRDYYLTNISTVYNDPIYRGDVVIFMEGIYDFVEIPEHAMMISHYNVNSSDYLLSGHSNNDPDKSLLQIIKDNTQYDSMTVFEFNN